MANESSEYWTHAEAENYNAWILTEKNARRLWVAMGGEKEEAESEITCMCGNRTVRKYKSIEGFLRDENKTSSQIECVYFEVTSNVGKKSVVLHHVGIQPSATVRIKAFQRNRNAEEVVERLKWDVEYLKPWWSFASRENIAKASLGMRMTICAIALWIVGKSQLILHETNIVELSDSAEKIAEIMSAVGMAVILYDLMVTLLMHLAQAVFPQGICAIGQGVHRYQQVKRRQKIIGWGLPLMLSAGSLIITLIGE